MPQKSRLTRKKNQLLLILGISLLALPIMLTLYFREQQQKQSQAAGMTPFLYAAIDTMKESKDTGTDQLTDAQIANHVNLAASLNTNYITVDVPYDFPEYFASWVKAIRATGKHIWFRSHWNQWENDYGNTGIQKPDSYVAAVDAFIRLHQDLFQPGDIFDACPEPENGKYWAAMHGTNWLGNKTAMDEYNKFLIDLTTTADAALQSIGITGIDTRVHSTNGWIAMHTDLLYPSTTQFMGKVTTDSYLGQDINISPADSAAQEKAELDKIFAAQNVPVILGEYGWSTAGFVSDQKQQEIIQEVLKMLETLPYLQGANYWVGADGTTAIFSGQRGNWLPRPAAHDLAAFFQKKLQTQYITPTANSQPTANQQPTVTPTPIPSGTRLGGLNLDAYCKSLKKEGSELKNGIWYCTNSRTPINMTRACQWLYHTFYAIALQDRPNDPYSWSCYSTEKRTSNANKTFTSPKKPNFNK